VSRLSSAVFTLLFSFLAVSAGAVSVPLPPQSPVPSYSPDDIPPTNVDIVTYTGAIVKARANHNMVFVEMSPLEQRVWFGPDASPGLFRTFYNKRVRDYVGGPWRWLYSYSPEIIRYSAPSSSGPAAVLYSSTKKYGFDPSTSQPWHYVMYQVFQPGSCDGVIAGFLYVSYSNDGEWWTDPAPVTRSGGPSFPCFPSLSNGIPIEQMTAIDIGDKIALVGVEGNIADLAPQPDSTFIRWTNMQRTQTYLGYADYATPATVTLHPTPELSNSGLFLPMTGPWTYSQPMRYAPYAYFMNLQMAYDASGGYLYIGRGYPYGYDRGSYEMAGAGMTDPPYSTNVPDATQLVDVQRNGPNGMSSVEGCLPSPYTLPNRVQVYRMYIGSPSNIGTITSGSWTLVRDFGGSSTYQFANGSYYGLVPGQTNAGHDFGAVSFLRDGRGYAVRDGGALLAFGAHTYKESKSVGPCRITGLEREVLVTLP
jgi:hypothetical protein